jgi:AraC-like DNA-binding protein
MGFYVRSAVLVGYEEVAASVGIDALDMLSEIGLHAASLRNIELKIPVDKVAWLLEHTAEKSGCDTIGLRMAESRKISNLGMVAMLVRDQATVRNALNLTIRYLPLHNQGMSVVIEEERGICLLRPQMRVAGLGDIRQSVELFTGALFRILGFFLGEEWRPQHVAFQHSAPRDLAVHKRLFGAVCRFEQSFDAIVLRAEDLDRPLKTFDPVMSRYARQLLDTMAVQDRHTLTNEVNQIILATLPSGRCTADTIAAHLGMDRRTLHRRLLAEQTSFTDLLLSIRKQLLERQMSSGHLSMAQIALQLGFSNQSVFSQWHRREFGQSATGRLRQSRPGFPLMSQKDK